MGDLVRSNKLRHAGHSLVPKLDQLQPPTTTAALSDVTKCSQALATSVNPSGPNMPFPWGFNVPNSATLPCTMEV